MKRKCGAALHDAVDGDVAAVELENPLGNSQPQSHSPGRLLAGVCGTVEGSKDVWEILRQNPRATIAYLHGYTVGFGGKRDRNDAARRRIVQGILQEIVEHPLDEP